MPTDKVHAPGNTRWFMLALVMLVTCLNYLDRSNLGIAASTIQKEYGISNATLGVLSSAFLWMYTFCLPFAGLVLDRVGPRLLYGVSIIGWSVATAALGFAGSVGSLIGLRVAVGLFEAPAFPTNVRCVTTWHPAQERAFAVGCYTSMLYVGPAFLTPVLAWILVHYGWRDIFYLTGGLGLFVVIAWSAFYRDPQSSRASPEELSYIKAGGGLGEADSSGIQTSVWDQIPALLSHRQVWGMFVGQFSVQTTLFFFLTWFPPYLINGKGMTVLKGGFYAAIPYFAAILGTVVAGKWSDWMVHRGVSNTVARKLPIILGFVLSTTIMGANYTDQINIVIAFMCLAFFGQATASTVTGALLSDIAPRGMVGTLSGMLYCVANTGGLLVPIIVGYSVDWTGGYNVALGYVSVVALLGMLAYLFVLGPVHRIEIKAT